MANGKQDGPISTPMTDAPWTEIPLHGVPEETKLGKIGPTNAATVPIKAKPASISSPMDKK